MMNKSVLSTDFCIVGGGLAGVCAAIAAARNGLQVVLIQDRAVLGGNASSEIRMHAVGADCHGMKAGARESGIIEELRLEDAARNSQRSYSCWDLLLYEKVRQEANITLLLETTFLSCQTEITSEKIHIHEIQVVSHSTEHLYQIQSKWFADCSGDGVLGADAGADFRIGREAKSEFGENLALDKADNKTLGSSILITARCHDRPMPFHAPSWARTFSKGDFKHRRISGYEYGFWWGEWGGQLDTIHDNEIIRHELLRIALGIWNYIKNSGNHADSANWALEWVGAIPGKRESRRFLGDHMLTENDIMSGTLFPDQVAYGGWPIDLHPPSGVDAAGEDPCSQHDFDHLYTIPLRSLYSRNVSNLFFAGRNISATHVAFASTRVMATCAVMGQAIGTAAAIACEAGLRQSSQLTAPAPMKCLQDRLQADDAFLPGRPVCLDGDLVKGAKITASSFVVNHEPNRVADGVTRSQSKLWGDWSDDGSHQWRSKDLPAWLEIDFGREVSLAEVRLTFDSGFQRELTLSASDAATSKMVKAPQPELLKDYTLWANELPVERVSGNYLRQRTHRLHHGIKARKIRIEIHSTNGANEARIFDIQAYSETSV